MNFIKGLAICAVFAILGYKIHWLFYLPAVFIFCVLMSAVFTPSLQNDDENKPKLTVCPRCKKRHYIIITKPEFWKSAENFLKVGKNRYYCRCLDCGKEWPQNN